VILIGMEVVQLGVDAVVRKALAGIERRDWDELKPLLHPYLHWVSGDGQVVRGRNNVLTLLAEASPSAPPVACELRDGQIYRWQDAGR
jgi:hypothetical protein